MCNNNINMCVIMCEILLLIIVMKIMCNNVDK